MKRTQRFKTRRREVDPLGAMNRWASQLASGGVQLLEELEEVQTDNPLFRLYLRIVEGALHDQGKTLYIGGTVGAAAPADGMGILGNRVRRVMVPAADAATMFFLNIQTLRKRSNIAANFTSAQLDELESGLKKLAEGGDANESPPVEWSLRQMVFRRAAE